MARKSRFVPAQKYIEMFRVTLASQLAYVYDVLLRQIFLVIIMFVFSQLWRTTFRLQPAATIEAFSFNQMLWYLAASESIVLALPQIGRGSIQFEQAVQLSSDLLRKVHGRRSLSLRAQPGHRRDGYMGARGRSKMDRSIGRCRGVLHPPCVHHGLLDPVFHRYSGILG